MPTRAAAQLFDRPRGHGENRTLQTPKAPMPLLPTLRKRGEQSPIDPRQRFGQVLGDKAGTGLGAGFAM